MGERPAAARPLTPTPDLSLSSIVKQFGSVTALAGVDLVVNVGELLTILGPSGSGKTTLLKVVAGFETPDAGIVALKGRDITLASPAKRDIGMVFQNYALFPHMTVAANIAFPLEMRGLGRGEVRERVVGALELVGLAGFEARLPRQLSGGQQQRVALARAVVFNPGLLLLDEPFGALDRKLREQMQLEVKRLQRRLALTALFVTHDQEEALILSDRIAVMNQGKIEQLGTPQAIYARPVNRFVADFIGESNLFGGRIESHGDGHSSVVLEGGARIRCRDAAAYPVGAQVALLVRPERPKPVIGSGGTPADNVFTGEIFEIVYLGESLKYAMHLDCGCDLIVRWPFAEQGRVLAVGDEVRVAWSADDMHVVPW